MNAIMQKLSPSATDMIRMDHTRVIAMFHRYDVQATPGTKSALAKAMCLALEIHARIEEEVFYPAMRSIDPQTVEKSVPEHDEMRRMMNTLRDMDPSSAQFDTAVMDLMRNVMHHVADEETKLLPDAERLLGERLAELGAQMSKRRLQLGGPRAGEFAVNAVRGMPGYAAAAVAGVAVLAGAWAMSRRNRHSSM
jgi:hemerythrin superfamily protein